MQLLYVRCEGCLFSPSDAMFASHLTRMICSSNYMYIYDEPCSHQQIVGMRRGMMLVRSARKGAAGGRGRLAVVPGQSLIYDADFLPYWERENTGNPEAFADEYIDLCIRK